MSKFGKPVDRTEWTMTPQTYNAYYNPSNNEIVLPAAIFMIPGMKDAQVDDAIVYGYAAPRPSDTRSRTASTTRAGSSTRQEILPTGGRRKMQRNSSNALPTMVKQFDAYEPLPGLHINGKASLGENIADYGGLLLGLDAFKKTDQYKKGETIGGLTPLHATSSATRSAGWSKRARNRCAATCSSDVHAPAKWRVIGPLANIPEFYEAFGVKQGQPMWLPAEARVHIW